MSSTTTITATSRQNNFRPLPRSLNRSRLDQLPLLDQPDKSVTHKTASPVHANMSSAATYYGQRVATCETVASNRDAYNAAQMDRWSAAKDAQNWQDNYQAYKAQFTTQSRQQHQPSHNPFQARQATSNTVSRQTTRPSTPNSSHSSQPASISTVGGDAQSMVLHSMQIPARISSKGGNLADFAAQLTCLFWFEAPKVLEVAEKTTSISADKSLPSLGQNAYPTESFRKWVTSVLTTTQVTQNVILLALMFIYRLKMTNTSVRGRPGSEYRLLTVALMLGNKFLDDNTYTNKTWAEVSGISVQEIHVMEVEFLSNMKYALLASTEQWDKWLDKLSSYYMFWDRVNSPVSPSASMVPSPTLMISSPTMGRVYSGKCYSPLASPTGYQSQQAAARAAGGQGYPPLDSSFTVSPPRQDPALFVGRKRSWDEQIVEPPAKRTYRPPQPTTSMASKPTPDARRLPVPSLTLNTMQQTPVTQTSFPGPAATYSVPQNTAYGVSLPPLEPGIRAMSTVYAPPTTAAWTGGMVATSGGPSQQPLMTPCVVHPPSTNAGYGTPTKRLSPINTLTPAAAYNASSPHHEYQQNGFHTPISNSPSIYLQHRPSPYRPIRQVRTLLNPPPTASMQGYQLPNIPPSQMQYHPLGRRNDQRTGIVPEYRNQDMFTGAPRAGHNQHPLRYPNLMN